LSVDRLEHTAWRGVDVVILLADFGGGKKNSFVWGSGYWREPG
jgi:hypothetical protein